MKIVERKINNDRVNKLVKTYKIDKNIARFLVGRNFSDEIILALTDKNYNLPESNNVTNVESASYLIAEYLQNNNAEIYIYADYDSDGVNGGFIMHDCLTKMAMVLNSNCKVFCHYPDRSEGYGLSLEWCKSLVENNINKRDILVITVDNGITKKIETEYLLKNGINVLITDHHMPKENETPEDVIIVNPNAFDDKESKGLCGAGVAFKVCDYLLRNVYQDESGYNLIYLPHVAIATVTDMMPITTENIDYIKYGLYLIENDYCVKGISYYKDYKNKKKLSTTDIAFCLGPKINSCGRMEQTSVASQLFTTEDEEEVENVFNLIDQINTSRKQEADELSEIAIQNILDTNAHIDNLFLIAHLDNIGGVGGIIAANIVSTFGKPVMVLGGSGELLHGSARSIPGLDLQLLFHEQVRLNNMLNYGGHEGAAGVAVDKKKIKSLQKSLNDIIQQCLDNMEDEDLIEEEKTIHIDGTISLKDITKKTYESYASLPFFDTLTEPLLALKDVKVISTKTSKNNPNNICFTVTDGKLEKDIWAWKFTKTYEALGSPNKITLLGSVAPNFIPGKRDYVFKVQEIVG